MSLQYTYLNFMEGLGGFSMGPFTRLLGWTSDEVEVLLAGVRKEFGTRSYHGYQKRCVWRLVSRCSMLIGGSFVVYGQKPAAGGV